MPVISGIPPLPFGMPIVDPATGAASREFSQWWQQFIGNAATINTGVDANTAAIVGKADKTTQIIAGTGLTGGGTLAADRTLAIDTSAEAERIRDVIGAALVAGSNITITINDAGDTITIAASGGGGGSDLGPAWTTLTFGSSGTNYGLTGSYKANETFAVAAGQRIEAECYIYDVIDVGRSLMIGNGTNAYYISGQSDNNVALYRYTSGAASPLTATGTNSTYDYTGMYKFKLVIDVHAASNNFLWAVHNDQKLPLSPNIQNTSHTMVGTLDVTILTSNLAKCYARARVIG